MSRHFTSKHILVCVKEKSTQTMQLSFWAMRGNRNREKRNGVMVLMTFLIIEASMKGQPNFCAVSLINLVVDVFEGICPIHSGHSLRTASLVHRSES